MDFEIESSNKVKNFVGSNLYSESLVISEKSGPESQDRIIDIKLIEDRPETGIKLSETITQENRISFKSEWAKLRSKFSGESLVNGWFYPASRVIELDENSAPPENTLEENNINDEVKKLLIDTIGVFTENAGMFKDHLGELKQEIQTLPIFQGALKSLNSNLTSQNEDLKRLKDLCDKELKTLIKKQDEVVGAVADLNKSKLENSRGSNFENSLSELTDLSKEIKSENFNLQEKLQTIVESVDSLDFSKFQSALETIYKAVKKSIDENRERSQEIIEVFNEMSLKTANNADNNLNNQILNSIEEQLLKNNVLLSRFEKNLANYKKKVAVCYCIAMVTLGLVVGSTSQLF